jgi:hypothetical protein
MRRLVFVLSVAAFAGLAHADTNDALKQAIADFITEEFDDVSPSQHEAIAACILPVFDGVGEVMIAEVLAMDDFEHGLGVVLKTYPEREEILEECEEILG